MEGRRAAVVHSSHQIRVSWSDELQLARHEFMGCDIPTVGLGLLNANRECSSTDVSNLVLPSVDEEARITKLAFEQEELFKGKHFVNLAGLTIFWE